MKNVKVAIAGFFGGIGQPITGAIQPLMHTDGAEIDFVVEDNTGKGHKTIYRFDELNVDLRNFHHAFPILGAQVALLGIDTQVMKTDGAFRSENGTAKHFTVRFISLINL